MLQIVLVNILIVTLTSSTDTLLLIKKQTPKIGIERLWMMIEVIIHSSSMTCDTPTGARYDAWDNDVDCINYRIHFVNIRISKFIKSSTSP